MTQKNPSLFTLIILTAFAAVAALLYTPALPALTKAFQISSSKAQLTMTLFLVGYTIGQFFFGPITNRFGRKPTIYIGIAMAIVGSLLCIAGVLTHHFQTLLWGRFIQALGTSVGLVIAFAMINDVYEGTQARKIISYTTLAFATLPGIATFVGGLLVQHFHWISCFYALLIYSFFVLYLSTTLPETCQHTDPNALKLSRIIHRYKTTYASGHIVSHAAMWGTSTALVYIFAAIAPTITIQYLHGSPAIFGLLNLSTSFGLMSGNFFSAHMAHRLSPRRTIALGISVSVLGCIIMSALYLFHLLNLISFYVAIYILYAGLPLVFTNASALAAKGASDKATASSIITLTNMGVAVIGSAIVSQLSTQRIIDYLPGVLFSLIGLIFLLFLWTMGSQEDTENS